MDLINLSLEEIKGLIGDNLYQPSTNNLFLSRCFDDFNQDLSNLPVLSLPGGDLGELALILGTANNFVFEVDYQKAFEILIELIDGQKNFSCCRGGFYSLKDNQALNHYWQLILKKPADYHLSQKEIDFLKEKINHIKKTKPLFNQEIKKEIKKTAVVVVKGEQGVYPIAEIVKAGQTITAGFFVYQKTLVDNRRQQLAKDLIRKKAVVLYPGCDWQYLYQVMTDEADYHLWTTLVNLAKELPVFEVEVKEQNQIKINYLEVIS